MTRTRTRTMTMTLKSVFLVALLLNIVKATTVSSDGEHGKNLVKWLRSKDGSFNSKLEIRRADLSDPTSRFGIFANDDISVNESLIEVPPDCLVTGEGIGVGEEVSFYDEKEEAWVDGEVVSANADQTYSVEVDDDEVLTVDEEDLERELDYIWCYTVRNLVQEMKLGDDSKYAAYVNYLMDQSHGQLPAAWSKAGLALLNDVAQTSDIDLPFTNYSWWVEECNGDEGSPEEHAAMMLTQRGWDDILIPVFDMMSHRNGHWLNTDNSSIDRTWKSNVVLFANRDIQAGEEIYYSYNFCSDCGGRSFGYGTPNILRDYGFVEQYPQRWFFRDEEVAFELDEVMNTDGSGTGTGELKVNWLVEKVSEEGIHFCKHQLKRLKSLAETTFKSSSEGIPENEWEVAKQYNQALITAMEHAVAAADGVLKKNNEL